MKKLAFSYIRLSTDIQSHGDGKRRQVNATKEYAKELGYEYKDSLEDIGISAFKGKNLQEGKLGIFIDSLESGEIDPKNTAIFIESLDRISREAALDAFSVFTRILNTGVTIVTTIDKQQYTKEDVNNNQYKIYTAIGSLIRANDESETKSKRLKESWQNKRSNLSKVIMSSISPAWIEVSDDKSEFILKEAKAKTISKIFDLCIDDGLGQYAITKYLNKNLEEYPVFTKPRKSNRNKTPIWGQSYISKILHNKSTYGYYQPHTIIDGQRSPVGDAIDNYYPSVITDERFLLAQARMQKRKNKGGGRKGEGFTNLFTKILICGQCGSSVIFRNKGSGTKGGKYLRCSKSEMSNQCTSPAWKYDEFEETFFKFITEVDLNDIIDNRNDKLQVKKLQEKNDLLSIEIKERKDSNNILLDKLSNIDKSIADDVLNRLTINKKDIIRKESEKNDISNKISELLDRPIITTAEALREKMKRLNAISDNSERLSIRQKVHSEISNIIDEIIIHNENTELLPVEMLDTISAPLRKELASIGISSNKQLLNYFKSVPGKIRYYKSERYFKVKFNTGNARTIFSDYPSFEFKYSDRTQKFIAQMKKRKIQ